MRLVAAACVVVLASCLQTVSDEVDAGVVAPPRDAGVQPTFALPVDPCAWDGGGANFCFADTVVVFDGNECRSICSSRLPGEPGVFAIGGACSATCGPTPCEWNGVGERDAGTVTAWAFDGPSCIPIGGAAPGRAGVFNTREECETTCPCEASKLVLLDYPLCDSTTLTMRSGERVTYTPLSDPFWKRKRANLAELCRRSTDPQVERIECLTAR